MKYYVLDEAKNRVEAYDKEGVIALLEKAIADGSLEGLEEDTAFVSKIKSLTNGGTYHVDFVTQAKYNELEASGSLLSNCYYFITDDSAYDDIVQYFENKFEQLGDGDLTAGEALHASEADIAKRAEVADRATKTDISVDENDIVIALERTSSGYYKGNVSQALMDDEMYYGEVAYADGSDGFGGTKILRWSLGVLQYRSNNRLDFSVTRYATASDKIVAIDVFSINKTDLYLNHHAIHADTGVIESGMHSYAEDVIVKFRKIR